MKKLLMFGLLIYSINLSAEVYRWTDAAGKTHYGDKKPGAKAEVITEQLTKTNVDTSTAEQQKMSALFRKENEADREYQQQQAKPNAELLARCAEAKRILHILSGRVAFINDQGKAVHVSEAERAQKVIQLQQQIAENCPQ